jgi:hypothetical protein
MHFFPKVLPHAFIDIIGSRAAAACNSQLPVQGLARVFFASIMGTNLEAEAGADLLGQRNVIERLVCVARFTRSQGNV